MHHPNDRTAYLAAIRSLEPLQEDLALLPEFSNLANNCEETRDLLAEMKDRLPTAPHENDLRLLLTHLQQGQTLADRMTACKNTLHPS